MSTLYGQVHSDTNMGRTAGGTHWIEAWVQTTQGRLTIALRDDGYYSVRVGPANRSSGARQHLLAEGLVSDRPIPPGAAGADARGWREEGTS